MITQMQQGRREDCKDSEEKAGEEEEGMDYVKKVGRDYFEVVHAIWNMFGLWVQSILGIIATNIDTYTFWFCLIESWIENSSLCNAYQHHVTWQMPMLAECQNSTSTSRVYIFHDITLFVLVLELEHDSVSSRKLPH